MNICAIPLFQHNITWCFRVVVWYRQSTTAGKCWKLPATLTVCRYSLFKWFTTWNCPWNLFLSVSDFINVLINTTSQDACYLQCLGESLMTSLFTFFLINISGLCAQKAPRKTRIDYKHLKTMWNLVIGERFGSLGIIFRIELALSNCYISGWQKR